ncbi:MAG TPA: hypothetical protein VN726_22860 [Hanamia sp.]|nr:hypothetical protein [Hanamia sp.]
MLSYQAIEGQSLWDVCLNTYGSLDYIIKLIQDNGVDNVNVYPVSGQIFIWDETLTIDQAVNQISQNAKIIYATKVLLNGSVLSIVLGSSSSNTGSTYWQPPTWQPPNPGNMIKYQKTSEIQYTAAGGETSVILSELIESSIIQITREIQPLKAADFGFNTTNGQISITGNPLGAGETLYIIYGQIITS